MAGLNANLEAMGESVRLLNSVASASEAGARLLGDDESVVRVGWLRHGFDVDGDGESELLTRSSAIENIVLAE